MEAPETTNYMIAGYAVFFTVISFYIISLSVRWSKLRKDQQTLQEMEHDS
ncbi:MAG TPA: hypothetical protein VJZ78_00240 [Anaerolineales bacterium]|nr:hypothetical protein [Anaerolineales bacterium]